MGEAAGGGAGTSGAGTSGAGGGAGTSKGEPKKKKKKGGGAGGGGGGGAKPSFGAIPPLPHLAKVLPALRGLCLDVSSLLTFTAGTGSADSQPAESEDLELSEALSPPSVHYLLQQTHSNLKKGLAAANMPRDWSSSASW